MRSHSRSKLMWSVTVAALLSFAAPVGAIPLKSWDDKIPNAGARFKVLSEFSGAAVLDKETQLVWEQEPQTTFHPWDLNAGFFQSARVQCTSREIGNRKGWRLPSVHELASLVDPANNNPALPTGHPFNVQSESYWSATSVADVPANTWGVFFGNGFVLTGGKSGSGLVWCVRGGMNADAY